MSKEALRELWGTFSVKDHLQRHAFIADVLVYDRLVIPTPPNKAEEDRWNQEKWKPKRLRKLINILGERAVSVPWDHVHKHSWEDRFKKKKRALAEAVQFDVDIIHQVRTSESWQQFEARGRPQHELEQIALMTTRDVLKDFLDQRRDHQLLIGLPSPQVDVVAAYMSYEAFSKDFDKPKIIRTSPQSGSGGVNLLGCSTSIPMTEPQSLLNAISWQFFIPDKNGDKRRRNDEDLLKEAIELASLPETQEYRRAFHIWCSKETLAGTSEKQALQKMEDLVRRYAHAVRKTKVPVIVKWTSAITVGICSIAAVWLPALGAVGAAAGLVHFGASEVKQTAPSGELKAAAMFYDARKHFGWYLAQQPEIEISRFYQL